MTSDDLFTDPAWFPFAVDAARDAVGFIRTSRDELSEAPMLLQRFHRVRDREHATAPFAAAPAAAPAAPAGLIFHSAFCGSTLLARCLDRPGAGLALKEPLCVAQMAQERPAGDDGAWSPPDWRARVGTLSGLLSRPFAPGERVIVKLTYNANDMIPDYAAAHGHKIVLMYSGLRAFLTAVAGRGEKRFGFVSRVFAGMRGASPEIAAWTDGQVAALTPLQTAALSWSLQMELFQAALDATPANQAATLHFDDFLDAPEVGVACAAAFLGVTFTDAEAAEQAEREVFARHSKDAGRTYSRDARAAKIADVEAEHGAALDAAAAWLASARPTRSEIERLPRAL